MSLIGTIIWLLITLTHLVTVSDDTYWLIWAILVLAMTIDLKTFYEREEEEDDDEV